MSPGVLITRAPLSGLPGERNKQLWCCPTSCGCVARDGIYSFQLSLPTSFSHFTVGRTQLIWWDAWLSDACCWHWWSSSSEYLSCVIWKALNTMLWVCVTELPKWVGSSQKCTPLQNKTLNLCPQPDFVVFCAEVVSQPSLQEHCAHSYQLMRTICPPYNLA